MKTKIPEPVSLLGPDSLTMIRAVVGISILFVFAYTLTGLIWMIIVRYKKRRTKFAHPSTSHTSPASGKLSHYCITCLGHSGLQFLMVNVL